ncbi:MAG: sulfotransferase [Sphingopyxis sp.]
MNGITQQMNAAMAAYTRGDLKAARSKGEVALRLQPNNASILQFLGVASCQAGDMKAGADYLRKAIANGGDSIDNRLNLAKAYIDAGQHDKAAALCEGALAEQSPELQRLRADILKLQGRAQEAIWKYEDAVVANPDDFESWNNLGNTRHEAGDFDGAMIALQRAREINEKSSVVHTNIGRLLISMDRHEEACLMLEKAALLAPQDPKPLLELGRALTSIDHAAAGLKALGTAARLDSSDPKIFVAIGQAFTDLADLAQAERAFRFAIQANSAFSPAYLNLGILLEKANRLEDLHKLMASAKTHGVEASEQDYLNALLLSRMGETAQALELAQRIETPSVHPSARYQFIGQLADKLGNVDDAFKAYEHMNRAMAESPMGVGVDRSAYQRGIAGLTAMVTDDWYAGWSKTEPSQVPPSPVFLVGFPRSGTTLLDTILMGHSGTHVLEEIPIIETISQKLEGIDPVATLNGAELTQFRAMYFDELAKTSPAPAGKLVIDKNPLSMIRMPLIHRLFPDAKIILAMRHPCDVVLSCYMQNFKATEAMSSFLDLPNASRTYGRIFEYWEKCRAVMPLDVHMLRYEEMIDDLEGATRPLFDFLGLPWEDQVLDHQKTAVKRGYIRTPSYAQVTEKIYTSSSGRWQRYRSYMNEVLPILAPWASRYGYDLD